MTVILDDVSNMSIATESNSFLLQQKIPTELQRQSRIFEPPPDRNSIFQSKTGSSFTLMQYEDLRRSIGDIEGQVQIFHNRTFQCSSIRSLYLIRRKQRNLKCSITDYKENVQYSHMSSCLIEKICYIGFHKNWRAYERKQFYNLKIRLPVLLENMHCMNAQQIDVVLPNRICIVWMLNN